MNKKDQNIVVKEKLMTQKDIVFTCGHKDTLGRIQEYKVYTSDPSDVMSFAITENSSFGKMIGRIKYSDVKFVNENPLEKIPGFLGTEKG